LLGKYIDPNVCTTSSSIYTSLKLSTVLTSTSFGTNPIIDSIVLSLVYDTTVYGKKDRKQQTLNIYQLTEVMDKDKVYASNNSLSKSSYAIANQNFIPKPFDSVLIWGKKEKPQLRIKMDNNFGQTILNNQTTGNLVDNTALQNFIKGFKKEKPQLRIKMDNNFGQTILNNQTTGNLVDNTALQNFIKGFYITTENTNLSSPGDGNILKFKMGDAQTKLTLYYRNTAADSLRYDFGFSGVSRFLSFNHNYSGANVDAALTTQLNSTAINQNSTIYIQSMAGIKAKVQIPWLKKLNDSGMVSINKAELVIKLDQTSTNYLDTFAAPKSLIIFGINDDGTSYIIPDAVENPAYYNYDGTYNKTTKEYRFNMNRYVQQILTGKKENNGFYILAQSGAVNANRVIIGGGGTGNYQMKLNITYTKLH